MHRYKAAFKLVQFFVKAIVTVTATVDVPTILTLVILGDLTQFMIGSICVASPKVAKSSRKSHCRWHFNGQF